MDRRSTPEDLYLLPTPSGAYYAVSRPVAAPQRKLLQSIMQHATSPPLSLEAVCAWSGIDNETEATHMFKRLQKLGWVQGMAEEQHAPKGSLAVILPDLLKPLSGNGNVLLADHQGFYIAGHGFDQGKVEEISALTADLASLQERHMSLLTRDLDMSTSAWALVDAAGNSQIGFWPLYIGEQRFVLAVEGMPCLNQTALTQIIWALSVRYGMVN
ncbi:MAG: hypothetical protein OEY67_09105 [Gammaproteobacteria bacterium]|nr:hypothetical protein [Gammaproteobacteria bacterium]